MPTKGYCVSLQGDENVLKLIVVMVAQLCDYSKFTLNCNTLNG